MQPATCSKPVSWCAICVGRRDLPAIKLPANLPLAAPTVFDGPACPNLPDSRATKSLLAAQACLASLKPYWVAPKLAWSTLTPGPMVLETETFLR